MKNSTMRTQSEKRFAHLPADDNRPLAIGANFHDDPICRSTQRKSHNLLLDRKVDYAPHTEYTYSGGGCSLRGAQSVGAAHHQSAAGTDLDDEENIWDGWFREELSEEDKKGFIVRLLGYFVEKVTESPTEEERVRKVCIKFFLDDDSVSIVEAKDDNSGIVQALILSRRRVPQNVNDPNNIFLLEDFRIGESVCIYGQTYHIVDMDRRSRRYFREVRGEELPEGLPVASCSFSAYKERSKLQSRKLTADDMDAKRAAEQQLTGIYTKHSNEDIAIAKQFLKNKINEHLTFLALWDDRGNLSGDVHFCAIRLFLENSTIEIAEKHAENCGRMTGPILLSRQRVPKPGTDLEKSRYQQHTYGKLMKTDYLGPEDFKLASTYSIFGKPFYVYDADEYTREYMLRNYGTDLGPADDISPFVCVDAKKVLFHVPPPNGFGSEKERRDNWLALIGKTARIDQDKVQREAGRIMNFSARLANPLVKGDEHREFIITFYRETDELEINERPQRNSGFLSGCFLTKGKHRKELPNGAKVLFEPSDFTVGEVVVIFQRPFLLTEMDEGTRRILEGSDNPTTDEKIKHIVVLLKQQINLRFTRANEAYLALAPNGTLGFRQIKEFLRSSSCNISDEEALLVVQNISPGTNGVISFDDFLVILNASAESMDEASMSTRSVKNVNMSVNHTMTETANTSEDKHRRRDLQVLLQQKLIQRQGSTKEQFRLLGGHSANARMQREAFRHSLNHILHFNMSKKDEDMMVSMLFDGNEDENGEITYKHFQEFVDSTTSL